MVGADLVAAVSSLHLEQPVTAGMGGLDADLPQPPLHRCDSPSVAGRTSAVPSAGLGGSSSLRDPRWQLASTDTAELGQLPGCSTAADLHISGTADCWTSSHSQPGHDALLTGVSSNKTIHSSAASGRAAPQHHCQGDEAPRQDQEQPSRVPPHYAVHAACIAGGSLDGLPPRPPLTAARQCDASDGPTAATDQRPRWKYFFKR